MDSTTQSEAPAGLTVADGLREVAAWLDRHPEVTPDHAFVSMIARSRGDLETLADALGGRAEERALDYGNPVVEIRGRFASNGDTLGGVQVYGQVPIKTLAGTPVQPKYEPIIKDWTARR
jgi:hypothetical protein